MKKIPTLFKRIYNEKGRPIGITPEVTSGCEWVLNGEGEATIKYDGSCCAIIDGKFYKRYDAKKGKTPPVGAIPCCDSDPITGHWPHWVLIDPANPSDKHFIGAYKNAKFPVTHDNHTYEAVGPHFNGNPYNLKSDHLVRHGCVILGKLDRSFEGIKHYLQYHDYEGIVFWKDGEPKCKIKRVDFGLEWPVKR